MWSFPNLYLYTNLSELTLWRKLYVLIKRVYLLCQTALK